MEAQTESDLLKIFELVAVRQGQYPGDLSPNLVPHLLDHSTPQHTQCIHSCLPEQPAWQIQEIWNQLSIKSIHVDWARQYYNQNDFKKG